MNPASREYERITDRVVFSCAVALDLVLLFLIYLEVRQ